MAGYNDYSHNKHDSDATRIKKADAAKRGILNKRVKAREERARIAQRIEAIGQRNDIALPQQRHDVIWFLNLAKSGGFLRCKRVG